MIRSLEEKDLEEVLTWDPNLRARSMPFESSFVFEHEGSLLLVVSCLLTNVKLVWVENFISNPRVEVVQEMRRAMTLELLTHLEEFARSRGFEKLFCMAGNGRVGEYFERLGFRKTIPAICYTKEIA